MEPIEWIAIAVPVASKAFKDWLSPADKITLINKTDNRIEFSSNFHSQEVPAHSALSMDWAFHTIPNVGNKDVTVRWNDESVTMIEGETLIVHSENWDLKEEDYKPSWFS